MINLDIKIYSNIDMSLLDSMIQNWLLKAQIIDVFTGDGRQNHSLLQMDEPLIFYDNTVTFLTSGIGVTVTGETKTTTLNVTGITTTNNLNVTGTATIASIGSTVGISSNFYFGDDNEIYLEMVMIFTIYHDRNAFIIQESGVEV